MRQFQAPYEPFAKLENSVQEILFSKTSGKQSGPQVSGDKNLLLWSLKFIGERLRDETQSVIDQDPQMLAACESEESSIPLKEWVARGEETESFCSELYDSEQDDNPEIRGEKSHKSPVANGTLSQHDDQEIMVAKKKVKVNSNRPSKV